MFILHCKSPKIICWLLCNLKFWHVYVFMKVFMISILCVTLHYGAALVVEPIAMKIGTHSHIECGKLSRFIYSGKTAVKCYRKYDCTNIYS